MNPDLARYERLKAAWIAMHPGATCREYERAVRQIARQCGV